MSNRPSLRNHPVRDAPDARGREAIFGPATPTVDRQPSTSTWGERHKRVTFYCPVELLSQLEAEMDHSGRTKSGVIVDAIRQHLTPQPG